MTEGLEIISSGTDLCTVELEATEANDAARPKANL